MAQRRPANPFRAFKSKRRLTWAAVAEEIGCGVDYAKKLGCEDSTIVSPTRARDFERRSNGEISYMAVMRWIYDRMEHGPVRDAA